MSYFQINGIDCIHPDAIRLEPSYPFSMGWYGKVNSMHLYRGRRPSECHLLVSRSTLDAINEESGTHTVSILNTQGTSVVATNHWTVTHVEAIGQTDAPNQTFYIILKDPRHMLTTVAKTPASVIANTWEEEIWPSNSTYTYQQVLEQYWSMMPTFNKVNSSSCPTLAYPRGSYAETDCCQGETLC